MQYDPSLEWPGEYDESDDKPAPAINTCFRLIVKSSTVLASRRKVAVLDSYVEAEIGRDVSNSVTVPRIRLKDMEVSKIHATLFWEADKNCMAIVDMGSKHGTFVGCSSLAELNVNNDKGTSTSETKHGFKRLSAPRQASLPHPLRHLDELSVGSTLFIIHVHSDGQPCVDCASQGELDIPLFHGSKQICSNSSKATENAQQVSTKSVGHDAKIAISQLKRKLLSRHSEVSNPPESSQTYIDRAAKRRALYPYSRPSSPPGVSSHSDAKSMRSFKVERSPDFSRYWNANSPGNTPDSSEDVPSTHSVERAISAPPVPSTSIGHLLLTKQGWKPGSTLGVASNNETDADPQGSRLALIEPLQPVANIGRQGLGSRNTPNV